jgi:hypothetical protein
MEVSIVSELSLDREDAADDAAPRRGGGRMSATLLDGLMAAGFDSWEMYIPYDDERPYQITLWRNDDGPWKAVVENTNDNYNTVARSEAETPSAALWGLTGESGDDADLPAALVSMAARLYQIDVVQQAFREREAVIQYLAHCTCGSLLRPVTVERMISA